MRAAVFRRYGPAEVLSVEEVETPRPAPGEVLVKVHASSVTTGDWRIRASAFPAFAWLPGRLMFGLFRPRRPVPGCDFSGEVAAVGAGVSRFKAGDAVFGFSGGGANAEFVAVAEGGCIAPRPAGLSDAEAAALPFGALGALVFLRDFASVAPGQRVMVVGVSGGVGTYAVQVAKHLGAHVTGVCSAGSAAFVRGLGADEVLDYAGEGWLRAGDGFDVVLDTCGGTSFGRCRRALAPRGLFVPLEFDLKEIAQALVTRLFRGRRVVIGVSGDTREDLDAIASLVEAGALRPAIDSRFPLEGIVEAHRRVEGRQRRGAVVIDVAESGAQAIAA